MSFRWSTTGRSVGTGGTAQPPGQRSIPGWRAWLAGGGEGWGRRQTDGEGQSGPAGCREGGASSAQTLIWAALLLESLELWEGWGRRQRSGWGGVRQRGSHSRPPATRWPGPSGVSCHRDPCKSQMGGLPVPTGTVPPSRTEGLGVPPGMPPPCAQRRRDPRAGPRRVPYGPGQ